ncbi:MAG: DNA primase, partial [Candidatus Omnitrophica bacterium]|nr:DNA primase [Candidatus Omnitrophota bacterium]
IPLRRAGRHFKALCPFHKERTPSFHINTEKQIFHCFGCQIGGNVFGFLMHQERLTFPEAVRQLAEQTGVRISMDSSTAQHQSTEPLLGILEKSCRYYERLLSHPSIGKPARAYLNERGVSDATREAFRLGYAPGAGEALVQAATRSHSSLKLLDQAGLTLHGTHGPRDRFRQRLIFPVQDVRGRVVSFGGRGLAGQEPKYLNGPETPVYMKGRHLFGLAQAKQAIGEAKQALVVEGYFDCAVLWQAGFQHVVSPLGTAFTTEQANLLARYTDRVVLAFDADTAGEAATLRGIDILVERGFQVAIAQLPDGVDPDELVRAHGIQALQELVAKALGVLEFLLAIAVKRYRARTVEEKVQAAQFMLPTLAKIPNAMLRAEYVRALADRLHLDERAVVAELGKAQPRHFSPRSSGPPTSSLARRPTPTHGVERLFTALLLDQPAKWDAVKDEVPVEGLSDERLQRIVSILGTLRAAQEHDPTPAQVISRLTEETEMAPLVSELVQLAQNEPAKEEAFRKCVQRLKHHAYQRQ